MTNWYDDEVCGPVKDRLSRISEICQDENVQKLVEQCYVIMDSAGTTCPSMEEI